MSCLASNLITWCAPRSNMTAPSSHGIMRPLNSMIGVPALIGRAANNPTPLTGELRFCHSRFRRCSLISSSHSFIDRILLFVIRKRVFLVDCDITTLRKCPRTRALRSSYEFIVNANDGIMRPDAKLRVFDGVIRVVVRQSSKHACLLQSQERRESIRRQSL